MVWDCGRSILYRAVDRHNSGCGTPHSSEECHTEAPRTEGGICSESTGSQPGGILQLLGLNGLFSGDNDSLLLIALILVLLHEKADIKLIIALAFVLLA